MLTLPDFAHRERTLEIMDDRAVPARETAAALDEIAMLSRALNGYAPSVRGIRRLLPVGARAFSLLDVGSGGGDVAQRLHAWARARGCEAHILGIDVSAAAVAHAARRCSGIPQIQFERADLFELSDTRSFDIVHSALTLHHFDGNLAIAALQRMFSLSRWGVVINDLHRHPIAYYGIRTLTRFFSTSRLIRNDAPLSVLRAFRRADLERLAREAGLGEPEIRWHWGFRWSAVCRR